MIGEHWFWWLVVMACLLWYSTITVYVAIKGGYDIVHMLRRLSEPGGADSGASAGLATRGDLPTPRYWWLPALLVLAIPLTFTGEHLRTAQRVPALAIVCQSPFGNNLQLQLVAAGMQQTKGVSLDRCTHWIYEESPAETLAAALASVR